jgi:hypothetical protein
MLSGWVVTSIIKRDGDFGVVNGAEEILPTRENVERATPCTFV